MCFTPSQSLILCSSKYASSFLSYLILDVVFLEIAGAVKNLSSFVRASSAFPITRCLLFRSAVHIEHSLLCKLTAPTSFSQAGFLQEQCLLTQLPGTVVGRPCKKFQLSADKCPLRISCCTSKSHGSSIRTHSFNSVTPWTECLPSPQKILSPCAAWGFGSYFFAQRMKCTGMFPRKPPFGGSSCQKSPTKRTLIPPKGLTPPLSDNFEVPKFLTVFRSLTFTFASN